MRTKRRMDKHDEADSRFPKFCDRAKSVKSNNDLAGKWTNRFKRSTELFYFIRIDLGWEIMKWILP